MLEIGGYQSCKFLQLNTFFSELLFHHWMCDQWGRAGWGFAPVITHVIPMPSSFFSGITVPTSHNLQMSDIRISQLVDILTARQVRDTSMARVCLIMYCHHLNLDAPCSCLHKIPSRDASSDKEMRKTWICDTDIAMYGIAATLDDDRFNRHGYGDTTLLKEDKAYPSRTHDPPFGRQKVAGAAGPGVGSNR